jgi:hypothetical protein
MMTPVILAFLSGGFGAAGWASLKDSRWFAAFFRLVFCILFGIATARVGGLI